MSQLEEGKNRDKRHEDTDHDMVAGTGEERDQQGAGQYEKRDAGRIQIRILAE